MASCPRSGSPEVLWKRRPERAPRSGLLVLSETRPASREYLASLPPGAFTRFATGPEILSLVHRRGKGSEGEGEGEGRAVAGEAYLPFSLSSRELRIVVAKALYERTVQRLGELLIAYLRGKGYLVAEGEAWVTPDNFELTPILRNGLPLYLAPAVLASHKQELYSALGLPPVLTYLYNETAAVTPDHLAYAAVAGEQGTTAAGAVPFPGGAGIALGPGLELLGLTWLLPGSFPPVVPQLDGTLRNVPVPHEGFPGPPRDVEEARNLGVIATTTAALAEPQEPRESEASAAIKDAQGARNRGWVVVDSGAVMAFARQFFKGGAGRDGATYAAALPAVPLAIAAFDEQLAVTRPVWAVRLPPCDFLAVTGPFLAAAAAAARLGELPLCPLVGSWLNFAKAADREDCFVLPLDPLLVPPAQRRPSWNDELPLLLRSEADFEPELRLALVLPLYAAYYSLFPTRATDFGLEGATPRVGEDLKLVAPLASLAEARSLVRAVEAFVERPGLRLRLARCPSREAGVVFRREVQRAGGGSGDGMRSFLISHPGREEVTVAYVELEADTPPVSAAPPFQVGAAALRRELGEYLEGRCHNEAGVAHVPFAELKLEEQLEIVVLESSPPYCLEAGVITELPPLNPFTRRPMTWSDELRARLVQAGGAGLFDVGVLRGILRGFDPPFALVRGGVEQEASPAGVLVTVVSDGALRPRYPDCPAEANWQVELLEVVPEGGGLLRADTLELLGEAWRRGLFLSRWGHAQALAAGDRFPLELGENWVRGDLNVGTERRLVAVLRLGLQLGYGEESLLPLRPASAPRTPAPP